MSTSQCTDRLDRETPRRDGALRVNASSSAHAVAESYFNNEMLNKSSGITHLGNVQGDILLSLVVVWVAVYFCIARGVWSTEKVVWLTVPLPCLFMCMLLLRGITLEG